MKPFYGPDTALSIKSRRSVFDEQYQENLKTDSFNNVTVLH